jgi:hypothetical protein
MPILWRDSCWAPRIVVRPAIERLRNTVPVRSKPGFVERNQVLLGPFTLVRYSAPGRTPLPMPKAAKLSCRQRRNPKSETRNPTRCDGATARREQIQNLQWANLKTNAKTVILSAFVGDHSVSAVDLAPGSRFTFYVLRFTNHVSQFRSLPTS